MSKCLYANHFKKIAPLSQNENGNNLTTTLLSALCFVSCYENAMENNGINLLYGLTYSKYGPTFHVTPVDFCIIFQCNLYILCIMSCGNKIVLNYH